MLGAVSRNDSRPRRDTSVSNTYQSRPLSGSRPAKRRSTSVQVNAINRGKRQEKKDDASDHSQEIESDDEDTNLNLVKSPTTPVAKKSQEANAKGRGRPYEEKGTS